MTERNAAVYEMKLATCRKEFDRVFRANKSLTAKLVEAEGKISDMNKLISEFEGDRAKLEQVSNLQREITKLTKDKRKLESELRGSKNQLGSLEASNKKLEEDLNRVFDDNEGLKLEIEKLHGENVRLSSELVGEVSAREKLARLPDKLTNDISALKQRLHSTEVRASNILQDLQNRIEQLQTKRNEDAVLINELQRQNKFQNEKVSICDEKLAVLEKANSELKNELNKRLEEIKKLSVKLRSIEALEKSSQFMVTKGDNKDVNDESNNQIVPDNEKTSHKLDTVAELTCRLNHAENENKQRQTEMQKLQCDVKSKNAEINSLRENIKSLAEERDALNEIIKNKEIQNSQRLQAVKMTYEGTLKVLYENHNESIARLQTQYEDAIKDSDYFDPESWLRSLSSKELAELHDRICMTISCSMSNEQSKPDNSESPVTSLQRNYQQDLNEKHQLNKRIATLENEIVQIEQEARQKVYELEIVIEQEKKRSQEMSEMVAKEQLRNAELQRRLTLSGGVSSKNQLSDGKTSNISIERSKSIQLDGSAESEKDILRRQSAYNQDRADNYGVLLEQQRKIVKNLEMELMDGSPKEKVFDWRKKNFIHQCSTYKKYENN
ncbi:putative leucine-rich repeat-containing protein DDB_G0290503 isoform X1 [Neodiprion pinetum]|uniref:putative leucine-rich repeat-containing protein DDB_G0290503 isoform X1 n=1 Tax=Neodiprion pinetum TaxID=441929 RepID=UPI001EDE796C|nr:uncharacterized protein MCAP_0864-like [Neodiprion pinetum]